MTEDFKQKLEERAQSLLESRLFAVYQRTDRLFGVLLIFEWVAGILIALLVSPLTWSGANSSVHIHVWTALILGGLIVVWPVYLSMKHPGKTSTRHSIAIAQMLYSALLIHL